MAGLEKWSEEYFKNAEIFGANAKTPTALLEDILVLNSLDDPRAPRNLLTALEKVPADRIKADHHWAEFWEFLRREQLTDSYRAMAKSYIFAISFKDMVKGSRIRKLLASAEALDNKKTKPANSEFFVGV